MEDKSVIRLQRTAIIILIVIIILLIVAFVIHYRSMEGYYPPMYDDTRLDHSAPRYMVH